MFLQKYVQEVDEQLARLKAAREKIASLAGPAPQYKTEFTYADSLPGVVEAAPQEPVKLLAEVAETIEATPVPAKRRGRPKGSKNKTTMIRTRRTAAPEPRALASNVPTGPVVVSPAQLAQRREPNREPHRESVVAVAAPAAPRTEQPGGNSGGGLDALIRELSERRVSAFSPAA